jgi:hypothetical protein
MSRRHTRAPRAGLPRNAMRAATLRDREAPYAMLSAGVAIIVGRALLRQGPVAAVAAFGWLAIVIILGVALMGIACLITSRLLGTRFGEARAAVRKLAATFIFPLAVWTLLPAWWSTLVASALYFALLLWLFDLEVHEAALFTLIMIGMRYLIVLGLGHTRFRQHLLG